MKGICIISRVGSAMGRRGSATEEAVRTADQRDVAALKESVGAEVVTVLSRTQSICRGSNGAVRPHCHKKMCRVKEFKDHNINKKITKENHAARVYFLQGVSN